MALEDRNIVKRLACKICLLGDGGVGKTSLRRTYLGEGFNKSYAMTIGADFAAKRIEIGNWIVTANIWDLAGQDKFNRMRETYYRGVSGALLVYDITRSETLDTISTWIKELKNNSDGADVPVLLIGNKSDLRAEVENAVSYETGLKTAKQLSKVETLNLEFIESSALTGENVSDAFQSLITKVFQNFLFESN